MQVKIKTTIRGTATLVTHHIRLSNPLDEWTQKLKALTDKRKKTQEDLLQIMMVEARAGCWETDDGLFAINNEAVLKSVVVAARTRKRGKDVERAASIPCGYTPVLINGKAVSCDELLKDAKHVDYRMVRVGSSRVPRSRPQIFAGWEAEFIFSVETTILDPQQFVDFLALSGRTSGLGELRPRLGTYEVVRAEMIEDEEEITAPEVIRAKKPTRLKQVK